MRKGLVFLVCLVGLTLIWTARTSSQTQGLADVARAEEARRKAMKNPASKVYTNDDLRGVGESSAAPVPAAAVPAASQPATAKPEEPAKPPAAAQPTDEGKKDEKYWKARVMAVEQAIARNKVLLEALQSRVNALTTDFTNVDDPAQRSVIEQNRKTALAEMARVKKESENQSKEITTIQDEARKANVPAGWLR